MSKRPTNVSVDRRKGESDEKMIRRFMKKVRKENVLREFTDRQTYKKPSQKRREKRERALRRKRSEERKARKQEGQ